MCGACIGHVLRFVFWLVRIEYMTYQLCVLYVCVWCVSTVCVVRWKTRLVLAIYIFNNILWFLFIGVFGSTC